MFKKIFSILFFSLILLNFFSYGQERDFFPEMKEKIYFKYNAGRSFNFREKGIKNDSILVFLSQKPWQKYHGTNYYIFYIKDYRSTYTDTLLLSKRNDTLFVSALKMTRNTKSNRAVLNLKNIKTIPFFDFKNHTLIERNYEDTKLYWFDIFNYSMKISIIESAEIKEDFFYVLSFDYSSFSKDIHKIFFTDKNGIFNIEIY